MVKLSRRACLSGLATLTIAARMPQAQAAGSIARFDPALDAILDSAAPVEAIATGYQWAEGPVWVKQGGYLLFSDVRANTCYRWKKSEGVTVFLKPSGLAGPIPSEIREAGSNGLALDPTGRLIMADSGSRAIAAVDLKTRRKTILADRYDGMRFNSCNDVAVHPNGTIYFTDPSYGLRDGDRSKLREIDFNGVFRRSPDGEIHLIANDLPSPNGVAITPDQQTLYVSVSDRARPRILAYPLDIEGGVSDDPHVLCEFLTEVTQRLPGTADGLKVARSGHVFASGPGGIYVLSPQGKKLGLIATGKAIANCAFGEDGRTLFLTSTDTVARVRLNLSGW